MQIYTGNAFGKKLDEVEKRDMGIMISTSPTVKPNKDFRRVPCALDNGAFSAFTKGYPFPEKAFMGTLDTCYSLGIKLDFITCPDLVAGGKKSLDFSMEWAMGKLKTAPRLALVVQDGIDEEMLDPFVLSYFDRIFVGGSKEWKWETAAAWCDFAKSKGLLCHIGQVGRLEYLTAAQSAGADTVDSTSYARNSSWNIIDDFIDGNSLFKKGA